MRVLLVVPAPAGSLSGNRWTAERWRPILEELGHTVTLRERWTAGEPVPDLLVALHAAKSADSIARFAELHPARPLVVVLTGTDLYGDLRGDPAAQRSLELASRLIALQPQALRELPAALAAKTAVIVQSAVPPAVRPAPLPGVFEVVVSGHLRPVKDPFRAAAASRLLPATSRVQISHLGAALAPELAAEARREEAENPRYHWLGALPRPAALAVLARAKLLVLSSLMEGGANVVSEAIACGVPVLATRIGGSLGLLGEDYPGFFAVGDTAGLAGLLARAETEPAFYGELVDRVRRLAPLVAPAREAAAWRQLLAELAP